MNTNDTLLKGFQSAMAGATQAYKADLRGKVDESTYKDVHRAALDMLDRLPKDTPLGTMAAALMLAATAYAEGASQARVLIETEAAGR